MKRKPNEILCKAAKYALLGIMLAVMIFLFSAALISTVGLNEANQAKENPVFRNDSLLLNILLLAGGIGLLTLLSRIVKKIPPSAMETVVFLYTVVFGILWVVSALSAPTHDSDIVTSAGTGAAYGDYSGIDSSYFLYFPFQFGYVLWTELWTPLTVWNGSYIGLQIVNVFCLAFAYVGLMRLTAVMFPGKELRPMLLLLLILFPQPIWFSTFLYGNIPSFVFSVWGVYFLAKHMEQRSYVRLGFSALFLLLSVVLKKNSMIVWLACCIVYALWILKEKQWKQIALLLAFALAVPLFSGFPQKIYEARTGKEFGKGIPMISWLAMGLNEDSTMYPGWYRGTYTVTNFNKCGQDPEAAAQKSKELIAKRFSELSEQPTGLVRFFGGKILSQWNEPTYESIWTNVVRGSYGEKWGAARFVCGEGREFTEFLCAWMQLLILFGAGSGIYGCFSEKKLPFMIPLVTVFGGFVYHALFEAKSQYILFYIVWLLPFAAFGLDFVCEKTDDLLLNLKYTILEAFRPKKAH